MEFCEKKDIDSCINFINTLEQFNPENFSPVIDLNNTAQNQKDMCLKYSKEILQVLQDSADFESITQYIEQIDLYMLAYLRNQNYYLEETHQKYYDFFKCLIVVVVLGSAILIFLNMNEIKKRDKIIYNSEQFLRHSMEVQEAERRRISRELHDTVAQNMRYFSLLAENLADKNASNDIISAQNQNIEDIRKLCYNLTPPNISSGDMISSLELMGQKMFENDVRSGKDAQRGGKDVLKAVGNAGAVENTSGTHLVDANTHQSGEVEFRIVSEDSVDFSAWNAEELMNIYRIVQEAFQNIMKHAEASEVTVLFKADTAVGTVDAVSSARGAAYGAKNGRAASEIGKKGSVKSAADSKKRALKIIITDDGKGMSEELVEQINSGVFENTKKFHFGVRNIVERVQLLGGTVTYRSEPNYGTQITVVL